MVGIKLDLSWMFLLSEKHPGLSETLINLPSMDKLPPQARTAEDARYSALVVHDVRVRYVGFYQVGSLKRGTSTVLDFVELHVRTNRTGYPSEQSRLPTLPRPWKRHMNAPARDRLLLRGHWTTARAPNRSQKFAPKAAPSPIASPRAPQRLAAPAIPGTHSSKHGECIRMD